jgi:apolipoprotein D and lipocalin family protein
MSKLVSLALVSLLLGCQNVHAPLEVVPEVELDRYLGRWYEIASFPHRFQKGCVATTATYTQKSDSEIRVENACRDGSFDGELRQIEGVAWVTDPASSNAKLRVQFFWPFSGDYWIIERDPNYRYAVVGHPSRDYLWILSRTPTIDSAIYQDLLERIEDHGFDPARLRLTPQPEPS